jgi:hypothetical protein
MQYIVGGGQTEDRGFRTTLWGGGGAKTGAQLPRNRCGVNF